MDDTNIFTVTIQAAAFSVLSTFIAQLIAAWNEPIFKWTISPFVTFALTALITTPPNYLYQAWLETTFPTLVYDKKSRRRDSKPYDLRRSKRNVLIKFLLDQSFGAAANTVLFIALSGVFKGHGIEHITEGVQTQFWALFFAGWRMWPFVSLANLWVVPWAWRPVVGNVAGLCWGVYLAVVSS